MSVLKKIEKLCRDFLWHGFDENKKMKPVSWLKICVPRSEGGLGIKQLRNWNTAALGKHLWTILTKPASLWAKWVHGNYLKGRSLWECDIPNDAAWAITKLFKLRGMYKNAFKVMLGDGRETLLFFDWWLPQGRNIDQSDIATQQATHWKTLKISEWRENGEWKIPSSFWRRWPQVARQICEQTCHSQPDKVTWLHTKSGEFSISSAYELLRHREEKVEWATCVWSSKAMPRQQFTLWLMFHNSLKTQNF